MSGIRGGELLAGNNLSDLRDVATARANLGVQLRLTQVNAKLAAMPSTASRLKILQFGDSYVNKLYGGMQSALLPLCGGVAGGGLSGAPSGSITVNSTTGTVNVQTTAFDAWPSGAVEQFTTGATRTYGTGGASFVANQIKVYYVLEPGAGTFKLQVDGVDAAGFTNVSAAGTLGQLGIATITPTLGAHTVTIVNLTGTVRIIGQSWENTTVNGLMPITVGQGGIPLNSATNSATAMSNFQAFIADALPDLMLFEMKEDSSYFAAALATLFAATKAGAPNMDVVGVGSPPIATNDADQVAQNAQLRDACRAAGYTYFDSYALYGSYARLTSLGFNGDGVHVSTACDQDRAMEFLRQTGILQAYGHTILEGLLRTPGMYLGRAIDTSAAGWIGADASFGLDPVLRHLQANRFIEFRGNSNTPIARFSENAAINWIPDFTRFGSGSNVCLKGESATLLGVRRGDNTAAYGDFIARSLAALPATLNNQSGAVTLDLTSGSVFIVNLTGNVTALAFSNAGSTGQDIEVHFVQDATGSRTLAGINAAIKVAGGTLTLTTTAGKRDIVRFRQISGVFYETSRSMNL